MKNVFATNSLWGVIITSSPLSKVIVLMASAALILCLFIFIYKFLVIREKIAQIKNAKNSLGQVQALNDLVTLSSALGGTLPGAVLGRGLKALRTILQHGETTKQRLSVTDTQLLEESMVGLIDDCVHDEQEYSGVLSVSAAAAPLIGLFGTITGLIQAFIAIAHERSADISAIAPGIAEALVTTFAGLVVAIPALVLYHFLMAILKEYEYQVAALVSQFEWLVKHLLSE